MHDGSVGIPIYIPQHQWIVCDSWTPLTGSSLLVTASLSLNDVTVISNYLICIHCMEFIITDQLLSPPGVAIH